MSFLYNSRGGSRTAATSETKKKLYGGCILMHASFIIVAPFDSLYCTSGWPYAIP